MAITTYDQLLAGMQQPRAFVKQTPTMAGVGGMRGHTVWYGSGNPGAATANSVGVNGAAVSGAVAGALPRVNPTGGANAYLAGLTIQASNAGSLWLIDRLWHNSGLVVTSTTAQAITPAALPARSIDATSNGDGIFAAVEWSSGGGAGSPTVTLTYTDQDGNTGANAILTGVASPPAGTFEIFTLAAGDTGVQAPTSFIQSATRTSGTMHLVLFRVLAQVFCSASNTGNSLDAFGSGMPRIYDDSVLQLVWFPFATTSTNIIGTYFESHG